MKDASSETPTDQRNPFGIFSRVSQSRIGEIFGFKLKSGYAVYKKGRCAVIEFFGVNELASRHNAGRRMRHKARRLLALTLKSHRCFCHTCPLH